VELLFERLSIVLAFREQVDRMMKDDASPSLQTLSRWINFVVEDVLDSLGKAALKEIESVAPRILEIMQREKMFLE